MPRQHTPAPVRRATTDTDSPQDSAQSASRTCPRLGPHAKLWLALVSLGDSALCVSKGCFKRSEPSVLTGLGDRFQEGAWTGAQSCVFLLGHWGLWIHGSPPRFHDTDVCKDSGWVFVSFLFCRRYEVFLKSSNDKELNGSVNLADCNKHRLGRGPGARSCMQGRGGRQSPLRAPPGPSRRFLIPKE